MSTVTLADISAFITKGATPTTYGFSWVASGVPFLRSECVSEHGLDMTQSMFISPAANQALQRSQVVDGDILMTITGYVGRVVRLDDVGTANINQHIARIRVKSRHFDSRFVYHYLSQRAIREHYESIVTGQAYPQISLVQVRDTKIPNWPLDLQRQVANALDDADGLIGALERWIAKKRAIKQGMMQELLTGRTRLPGFSGRWSPSSLRAFGECLRGVGYDPDQDLFSGDRSFTVRLLRANNVQGGEITTNGLQYVHERRVRPDQRLRRGDIVICMANGSRALVGKSALFDERDDASTYTFGSFMGVFRLRSGVASPRFFSELLSTHPFRSWLDVVLSGSSINNLRPGDIEDFACELPDAPEQAAIADVLSDVEAEIAGLRLRLVKAQAVKQGMMQKLLAERPRLLAESN